MCVYASLLAIEIIHVDEFIDELLRNERSCDIILPRIQVSNWYMLSQARMTMSSKYGYCTVKNFSGKKFGEKAAAKD